MQTKLDEAKAELLERAARVAENSPVGGTYDRATGPRGTGQDPDRVPPALLPAHRPGGPRRPRPGRRLRGRALPLPAGREPPAGHGERPGAHPDRRGERLDVQPLRGRGRHRRHALPGRLGHQRARPGQGRGIHVVIHPQFVVRRDITGKLHRGARRRRRPGRRAPLPHDALVESWIHVEIDRETDRADLEADHRRPAARAVRRPRGRRGLGEDARRRAAHRRRARRASRPPPTCPTQEVEEARELLRWLADDHFTFLGYREYDLARAPRTRTCWPPSPAPASASCAPTRTTATTRPPGQPVLRPAARRRPRQGPRAQAAGPDQGQQPRHRAPPLVPRLRRREEVRRRAATSIGERRFLGPVLLRRVHRVRAPGARWSAARSTRCCDGAGFSPDSHDGRDLLQILETYPRDELFQTPADELRSIVTSVLYLQERRRLRLYLRQDEYGRYYSALVYLPRDRYTTGVRLRLIDILKEELGGTSVDFTAWNTESILSRLHFVVRVAARHRAAAAHRRRHGAHRGAARRGRPLLGRRLRRGAERRVRRGARRRAAAPLRQRLPRGLQGRPLPARRRRRPRSTSRALGATEQDFALSLYEPVGAGPGERRFKIYRTGEPVSLSAVLPVLQRLGVEVVDERPYELRCPDRTDAWIYDFGLRLPRPTAAATTRRRRPRALPGGLRRRLDRRRRRTTASTPWCCAPG